ncbi:hypothetical protein PMIN06_010240 [Paraphaeosphaeria minitans]|uniref:Cytochrome P450 CYP13A3 n=1 Tax=Paraphaeosphaeria minitans TaxID=565426 RepID=A0A9P6KNW1_9PLEO|nr:cytochrome P450 CYP13A3 [Paraphaeosphaeria minitans]
MLAQWLSQPGGKVPKMVDDTRIVALHVLTAAGFGVQHDFISGARVTAPGHTLSHRDTLMTLLNNFITTMIIAPQESFFDKIAVFLSPRIKEILLALKEFRQYTDEAMASERKLLFEERGSQKHNLLSTLIRTSDRAKVDGVQSAAKLTDDEIRGNIFIFNVAGHDTAANTLRYAFALLAIHREVQEWVMEEIDHVCQDERSPEYEGTHTQLKRVMAVMVSLSESIQHVPYSNPRMEPSLDGNLATVFSDRSTRPARSNASLTPTVTATLRPCTPDTSWRDYRQHVSHNQPSRLDDILLFNLNHSHPSEHASKSEHPRNAYQALSFPQSQGWNPKRWITSPAPASRPASPLSSTLQNEKLVHMERGFAPWASGPRICPGMKFAQVEFSATLATVLRSAWIAPSVKGGGNAEETVARQAIEALLRDSHHIGATISMKRPEDLWLKVTQR